MNHDAAHVVGRDWMLTLSYTVEEVLSKIELEESVLPYLPDSEQRPIPPLPIDSLELLTIAALTFEHEEVEFCRIGHEDYDMIIYLDSGHSVVVHVDDPIVEKVVREQAERVKVYTHWWTD